MLRLTLIRHGNAEWKDSNFADVERPLNARGMAEAESIGKVLLDKQLAPDLLVTSTAKRTQQTTERVARALGLPAQQVKSVEQLYLARPEVILSIVQTTGPSVKHLAIVGHNPGISELARMLAPEGFAIGDLATAAAVAFTFAHEAWEGLAGPAAQAVEYRPAKRFGSA